MLKEGLRVLRGYSTNFNEQKSRQHMSRNRCLLRYGRCSCEHYSSCSVCGSHALQHNSQLFIAQRCSPCRKFIILLETHDRHCSNTYKPLIGAEYTYVSSKLTVQRIEVRRSCRPDDWASASYPLFMESLLQMLPPSCIDHVCCRW
jgi:hypothetical protein